MDRHFDQPVINTVQVESLPEVTVKVEANGGSLAHEPNEIPGIGTHAYFKDTEGNLFGALQPAST
jgi:predicted enzyme related to lactoylglutathione lyase